MARPAPDIMGAEEKRRIRLTLSREVEQRVREMRRSHVDEIVNDAHAIRILLREGLAVIEAGTAPAAEEVRKTLPSGGRSKDVQILASEFRRLSTYYKQNISVVDGVGGAARHALWIAIAFGMPPLVTQNESAPDGTVATSS